MPKREKAEYNTLRHPVVGQGESKAHSMYILAGLDNPFIFDYGWYPPLQTMAYIENKWAPLPSPVFGKRDYRKFVPTREVCVHVNP